MTGEKRKAQQQPLKHQQPLGAISDDASTSSGPLKRHQKEPKPCTFPSKEEDETLFQGKQSVDTVPHRKQNALTVSNREGRYEMERGAGMTIQARSRMSQALLSSLVNRFGDELSQGANSWLLCVPDQVEWVENKLRWTQAFLKDAEDKSDRDERAKQWIWEMRKLNYIAEDTMDTCLLEIERSTDSNQIIDATRKLFSESERMKDKIQSILESRVAYGIQDIGHEQGRSTSSQSGRDRRLLSSYVEEPDFVGFQADLEELMLRLTNGEPRLSVISIVGMGGQGKTTLARKLHQSDAIQVHFDFRGWIFISRVYGVEELLRDVVKKWKGDSAKSMDADQLRQEIAQHLKGKRYLVVLDDVWTCEAWDDLRDVFPNTSNGSRFLLTTRNEDVALYADPRSKPHKLRLLDEDESWELFLQKARPGCEADFPLDWEETRKEILSKCQGLPLAIAVIGGLLSRRKEAREWRYILKSIRWQLIEGEERISGILSLSYVDLPSYMKQCFLYLGVFPEGKQISYKKLIRLWAAEGFLQERGELTEEEGEECVCELVRRNLIEVFERSSKGSIKSCRIHDLLWDFILSKAEEDAFLMVRSSTAISKIYEGRRLAVNNEKRYYFLQHLCSNLRSLFIQYPDQYDPPMFDCIDEYLVGSRFKLLRVLDIEGVSLKDVPSEIGDLIFLRYLGLQIGSGCLWTNIGNLVNLQTLCITGFGYPIRIPNIILTMPQLRHVVVRLGAIEIEEGPFLDELCNSNLKTLETLGVWEEKNYGWLGRLMKLRKLKLVFNKRLAVSDISYTTVGRLRIWESIMRLESLESLSVCCLCDHARDTTAPLPYLGHVPPLKHLSKLCKLDLHGKIDNAAVLREFPRNVTKLTLDGSWLEQDPLPILENLENLRILDLGDRCYRGEKMTCSAKGFPQLQSLHIWALQGLREWRVEKGSMSSLLHLQIRGCWGLKDVPDLQHVPTLIELTVSRMPSEFIEKIEGEDGYKIEHVSSVHIS